MVIAFALDRWPIDLVAFAALGGLLLFNLVSPQEAVAGFSNSAVITVMMMFILSEALVQSGVVNRLGHRLLRLSGRTMGRGSFLLLLLAGVLSAFINNVAAMALLMPVAIQLAHHHGKSPSKILLPLSWVSIFGGLCTLIGTSTNLLVAALAEEYGMERFGVFEFLSVGIVLFVVGMIYTLLVPLKRLPSRAKLSNLTAKFEMAGYLTELKVQYGSGLVGRTVIDEEIHSRFRLNVLEILRGDQKIAIDIRNTPLEIGDLLLVRGAMKDILSFRGHYSLLMPTDTKLRDLEVGAQGTILAEVQVSPLSELVGKTIKDIDFRKRFSSFVIAINRTGKMIRSKITSIPLENWDILLVFGPRARVEALYDTPDFVPLQQLDLHIAIKKRWWVGVLTVPAVVILATFGIMSILKASILGALVILLTGCLTMQQAYKAINWTVIFLAACLIPLGKALENTGLAGQVGDFIISVGGEHGPLIVLALVFLITTMLTEFISNNSTVIMMVPVAFTVATSMGFDPKPFIMAVAFGGSSSFLTPVGYRTNAMVYAPGRYRFWDYIKFGFPLKLAFWIIATLLIPIFWPLRAL